MVSMYSAKLMDHFQNPRNAGKPERYSVKGVAGDPRSGPFMILYLDLQGPYIRDAKFQTYGCAPAIAAGSLLTELVKGRTISQTAPIDAAFITEHLGGLPLGKEICANLAATALGSAIGAIPKEPLGSAAGRPAHFNVRGKAGDPGAGSFLIVHLDVRGGVVRDATFETDRSPLAVAVGSYLAQRLKDCSLPELRRLRDEALAEDLLRAAEGDGTRSALAMEALSEAIRQMEEGIGFPEARVGSDLPIIHVYAVCHNEELLLPYFLRHYEDFAERIIIFD